MASKNTEDFSPVLRRHRTPPFHYLYFEDFDSAETGAGLSAQERAVEEKGQSVDRPRMPCCSSVCTVKSLGYADTLCDLSARWTSSGRLKSVNALGAS